MRNYELVAVLHPDLEIDLEAQTKKIAALVATAGGKVIKQDSWGKRKLAYTVKKQDWGLYVFLLLELDPAKVSGLDNGLRLAEEVIRHLIVQEPDKEAIAKRVAAKTKSNKPAVVAE